MEPVTDELLNACLDGELRPDEQSRLLAQVACDPVLQQRLAHLRRVKALVSRAYEDAAPTASALAPESHIQAPHRRTGLVAGAALLAAGFFAGRWLPAGTAHKTAPGLVLQISGADPAQWRLALEQLRSAREGGSGGTSVDTVLIAYGDGLGMLLTQSPVIEALRQARSSGVRLLACGNTLRQSGLTREALAREVEVAETGGPAEILRLQRLGYNYLHL
jgi:intracellular sulfur oxidation DsrE/DsrF family protein